MMDDDGGDDDDDDDGGGGGGGGGGGANAVAGVGAAGGAGGGGGDDDDDGGGGGEKESVDFENDEHTMFLLDELVTCLAELGLQLNVRTAKVLTTQSQSPTEVPLRNGQAIEVLDRGSTHTWLGCMLCTANTGNHTLDLAHHLHIPPCCVESVFFANRHIWETGMLQCKTVSGNFNAMVTPVACFRAAHKKVYKQDLCKMDIVFRRMLRSIVGPPGDVDWTLPSHEILHHWNARANFLTARHGKKTWSAVCLGQYWKFANYVSNLPGERWVVRARNWIPENARRVGRPAYTWDSMIQQFCIVLQAQSTGKLATTCPGRFLFDESIR